jgi:hypothetical protein
LVIAEGEEGVVYKTFYLYHTVLTLFSCRYSSAQAVGERLHTIANAKDREFGLKHVFRDLRGFTLIHRGRTT